MKLGAYDYLVKPLDAGQLQQVVLQAFEISQLMHVPAMVEDGVRPDYQADRLIGNGAAMQAICKKLGRVAPQDGNPLKAAMGSLYTRVAGIRDVYRGTAPPARSRTN